MIRREVSVAVTVAVTAMVVMFLLAVGGCGDQDDQGEPDATTPTGGAGGAPQPLDKPVRVTEGDWIPPGTTKEAMLEGTAAAETLQAANAPLFDGEIGGFRIGASVGKRETACPPGTASVGTADKFPFTLKYLPPNTFETYEPYLMLCPDGAVYGAMRLFQISAGGEAFREAEFKVEFAGAEKSIQAQFLEQTLSTGSVGGKIGVEVRPLTASGFGRSRVLLPYEKGYVQVTAYNLPFDEVLRIAEGVSCESC